MVKIGYSSNVSSTCFRAVRSKLHISSIDISFYVVTFLRFLTSLFLDETTKTFLQTQIMFNQILLKTVRTSKTIKNISIFLIAH